jgi:malonyl-CoA O-methyltransferase
MELDKAKIRRSFQRAAADYDEAAAVQRYMAGELIDRLGVVKLEPGRILDAGCGTGHALPGLRQRFPGAEFVLFDLSEAMLQCARRQAPANTGLVCGDMENAPIASCSIDLIFANAVMHWCDLERVIPEFLRILKPEGLLTFSTFGPDTLTELRRAWRQVDAGIHVHDFLDMHTIGDILVQLQFAEPVMDADYLTVTHRDFNDALRDLKALGAGNAALARSRVLTGARKFRELARICERFRNEQGLFESTMEIVFGHAWAPAQVNLREAGGGTAIPLSRLRRR